MLGTFNDRRIVFPNVYFGDGYYGMLSAFFDGDDAYVDEFMAFDEASGDLQTSCSKRDGELFARCRRFLDDNTIADLRELANRQRGGCSWSIDVSQCGGRAPVVASTDDGTNNDSLDADWRDQ